MDTEKSKALLSKVAEIELSYSNPVPPNERNKITNSRESFNLLKSLWSDKIELYEEFVILVLDRANQVLGRYTL